MPLYEKDFEAMLKSNKDPFQANVIKTINDIGRVKKAIAKLKTIVDNPFVTLSDYDIRGFVAIGGEPEKYYFNWDHKHLIYKSKVYRIPAEDYEELSKLVEMCGDWPTKPYHLQK